ncbi:MAG: hypothetical protein ACK462_10755, partial [Planctomyces sp.]
MSRTDRRSPLSRTPSAVMREPARGPSSPEVGPHPPNNKAPNPANNNAGNEGNNGANNGANNEPGNAARNKA